MKKVLKGVMILLIGILSIVQTYADVPYEVFKTKTISETTKYGNYELNVENGKIKNDVSDGAMDTRVKTRLHGINYKLEFRNVGKMGNEGWTSLGGYEKAKLTISFDVKESFHMYDTGKTNPMFGMNYWEEEIDETRYIDDIQLDLVFSGGPYGKFTHHNGKGTIYPVGRVVDGGYVQLENFSYNMVKTTLGLGGGKIPIENKMFGKWMEKLTETDCIDSGIRFSDYNGEVMIRPHSDEDAWYGAELDIVLCVDDHIKTGDDSFAVLSLQDMTTFKMKPESEIILSTPPRRENKLKLIAGKVLINVKRMLKDGTMDVEMSQATAGIKGTILELEETGTQSKIKVFEGTVEFTSKTTGEKSMIGIWETQTADKDGLSEKTTKDNKEVFKVINKERQEWEKIEEPVLKPLLSEEEIAAINVRDPDRGEIQLAQGEIAPEGSDDKAIKNKAPEEKSNNTQSGDTQDGESSNSVYYILLILIIILFGMYYFKNKKNKKV